MKIDDLNYLNIFENNNFYSKNYSNNKFKYLITWIEIYIIFICRYETILHYFIDCFMIKQKVKLLKYELLSKAYISVN